MILAWPDYRAADHLARSPGLPPNRKRKLHDWYKMDRVCLSMARYYRGIRQRRFFAFSLLRLPPGPADAPMDHQAPSRSRGMAKNVSSPTSLSAPSWNFHKAPSKPLRKALYFEETSSRNCHRIDQQSSIEMQVARLTTRLSNEQAAMTSRAV